MILIAIDGSSTKFGYSIWDMENKILLEMGYHVFKGGESLIKIIEEYKIVLQGLKERFEINEMVIEESFLKFGDKFSSAATIARLNQINILYQYVTYLEGIKVNTISVSESRKYAFPGYVFKHKKFSGGLSGKEQAFNLVVLELGAERFPTKTIKQGKNKGDVRFEDFAGDMADSYIVGKGFLNKKN